MGKKVNMIIIVQFVETMLMTMCKYFKQHNQFIHSEHKLNEQLDNTVCTYI